MTGHWLHHAHESFIQTVICQEISAEYYAFPDSSLKKIYEDIGAHEHELDDRQLRQKPDISIWYKSKRDIYAILEIKKAWQSAPVLADSKKIKMIAAGKGRKLGYLLVL